MSLNSVFRVLLFLGWVRIPPKVRLKGPLMEWRRGNLGESREHCLGAIFESGSTSFELSSDELGSRGIGFARAFDDEEAMIKYSTGRGARV